MSYNQSFTPQAGQGNLSAQFGGSQYAQQTNGASAPRDIPGRRRHSSMSGGYQQHSEYSMAQQGAYGTSPSMAYSPHGQSFANGPAQNLSPSPNQHGYYGSPSAQQYDPYSTSPQRLHPMASGPMPGPGWQQPHYPQHGPSSYPPLSSYHPSAEHRRKSSTSIYSHHSDDSSGKPRKSRRKSSVPSRYDSPRRPTMTDSVIATWRGLKGAFDARK